MPEPSQEQPPVSAVEPGLHELARLLRQADHLNPEDQAALSDLIDELARALPVGAASSAETTHLARTAAQRKASPNQFCAQG